MQKLALFFAALADPTRLRLLNLMKDGEICVCFLQGVVQTNQPKISRHLAYLRNAGLVEARRDGKWIHYRITKLDKALQSILAKSLQHVAKQPQSLQDAKRLSRIRCCPSKFGFSSPFDNEEGPQSPKSRSGQKM